MRDNCVIFTTPERQELRVVFDPDGTPFFCGPDLAAIAGYEQPRKAVTGGNQGVKFLGTMVCGVVAAILPAFLRKTP